MKPALEFKKRKLAAWLSAYRNRRGCPDGGGKQHPATEVLAAPESRAKPLFFEAMEPRLLLNADLPGVDLLLAQEDKRDQELMVRLVQVTEQAAEDGETVNRLQVIDLSNGNAVLASQDLDAISSITLRLGDGDDKIAVDTESFTGVALPEIRIDGGQGNDQLTYLSGSETVWDITGSGSGTVANEHAVAFSGFETLTGSVGNNDTFILHADGALAGGVDGGDAGFDVLEIRGSYDTLKSTVYDASSGLIDLDGKLISYTGLEPITVDAALTTLVLAGTGDDEVLLAAGPQPGSFSLSSENGAFETHIFTNTVQSITLALGTGADSFSSTLSDANQFVGNIQIVDTVDLTLGDVTGIAGNFTVETASAGHPVTGDSAAYDGSSIVISDGANLAIDGDLSLTVNAQPLPTAASLQQFISAPVVRGSIDIGDSVTIDADNIAIAVVASGERDLLLGIDTQALIQLAVEDAKVADIGSWDSLSFASQGSDQGTITRDGGSWLSDGFAVGQDIRISDAEQASNQTYRITAVTDTVVTVALTGGATIPAAVETDSSEVKVAGYAFVRFAGDDQISFGIDDNDTAAEDDDVQLIVREVPQENPDAALNSATSLTFNHSDSAADTIVRTTGSWLDEGFAAGQTIAVRDAGASNGNYTVTGVSAKTLTLSTSDEVSAASGVSGATVRGHTLGSFIAEGFAAGDEIIVQGSAYNDRTYTVSEVYDRSLVLVASDDIIGESVDLSSGAVEGFHLQVVKNDLALEDTPLVLMDRDGNVIEGESGKVHFTQAELEAAYAENAGQASAILQKLAENPIAQSLTDFGLKVWVSDIRGAVELGENSQLTAGGDISISSDVSAKVQASTPSVVLGVSVVNSTVSSSVDLRSGASVQAAGDVSITADTDHSMRSSMNVTSGTIQNPAQQVQHAAIDEAGNLDPTGFANFALPQGVDSVLGPIGFVRVPGPSLAIALGMADTDSAVVIEQGASVQANAIEVASSNQYNYDVSADSKIFQAGSNVGVGVGVAISLTDTDAITEVAGELSTTPGADGDIALSADSTVHYDEVELADGTVEREYTGNNSVSSSAWVKSSIQGAGGIFGALSPFSEKIKQFQDELREQTKLTELINENPGKFEAAAGISLLLGGNSAQVNVASTLDSDGRGGIRADGDLLVASTAVEKPNVAAAGTAETGAEIALAGGVAFAQYANKANTTISPAAKLSSGGRTTVKSEALVPNNITLEEAFYNDYAAAVEQFEAEMATAYSDPIELAEAAKDFALSIALSAKGTASYLLDIAKLRKLGLAGVEGDLLTSYVNSGAGGDYSSNDPAKQREEAVFKKDGVTPKFNNDGSDKTKKVSQETQSAKYGIAGNINILEIDNTADVTIGKDADIHAQNTLQVLSRAEMDTINLTGLTSVWDVVWSTKSKLATGADGASTGGSAGGVGASVGIRVIENNARNRVDAGAKLTSNEGDVTLDALTRQLHINVSEMGTDGGSIGISGSASVDVITAMTETLVDESSVINAAGDVRLNADGDILQVNAGLAGTEVEGGIAVGAAAGVNVLDSTVRAAVTDLDGAIADNADAIGDATKARIQAGGDAAITARGSETTVAVALAGSRQTQPDNNTQQEGENDIDFLQRVLEDQREREKATRLGIAGSANVDVSSATVSAELGRGASVSAGGHLQVIADQQRTAIAVAAGGILDQSTDGSKAALAGAFGVTTFERQVDAVARGAVLHAAELTVEANRRDQLIAVSAGGAGAAKSDAAVAGSMNINVFDNTVRAQLIDSVVDVSGDVSVLAHSDSLLVSVAGAIGLNLSGKAGVGAAFVGSFSSGEVIASIDNSRVHAGGDVGVEADNDLTVISVAASAGVSLEKLGVSGQLGLHMVSGETRARIGGGSTVVAGGAVQVRADDTIDAVNVVGGFALGGETAVGIAAASTNIFDRRVVAQLTDGSDVSAQGSGGSSGITVQALADDLVINVAVGAAASQDKAIQGSLVVDTNDTTMLAAIGSDSAAPASRASATADNGGNVTVNADYGYVGVNVVGGVAVGFGKLGLGASLAVSSHQRDVRAVVGSHASITADGSIEVSADVAATHVTTAFNAGVAKGIAGAGAVAVPVYDDTVIAVINRDAYLRAGDDIAVLAQHDADHVLANVAVAAALENFAGGVSAGVVVQNVETQALVKENVDALAQDSVLIEAASDATLGNAAGGVALGGKVGAGASAFLLVRDDSVLARVAEGAALTGLALGAGYARTNFQGSRTYNGVAVVADSNEKLIGVAVQGSGGGTAGIAGAAPVSVIVESTVAEVADGAQLNSAGASQAAVDQDVQITASDDTVLVNVAGVAAGGKAAGIGVSADVASVSKTTAATLGSRVDDGVDYNPAAQGVSAQAKGDIRVESDATEEVVSVAFGVAGAGNAAIGLNGGVYILNLDTHAGVGRNAEVLADGSIVVDALHDTELDLIAASVAASVSLKGDPNVSVAGSFDLPIVNKTVTSVAWEGAELTARGLRAALTDVHTGNVIASDSGSTLDLVNTTNGEILAPTETISGGLDLAAPTLQQADSESYKAQDYRAETVADTAQGTFKGVSVTATSLDDLQSITGGLAVAVNPTSAASGAVSVALDVDISSITTLATVKDSVVINKPQLPVDAEQSVMIAASSVLDHLGVIAAVAGSSGAAGSIVADVKVLKVHTEASVGEADIYAAGDITINAQSRQDLQSMALSVAGAGAALAPAVSVISLDSGTQAVIGDNADLDAGNSVHLVASDHTEVDALDGGLAAGGAALSPGVGVVVLSKNTQALIGSAATVNARANGARAYQALAGDKADETSTTPRQGVIVDARSQEDVQAIAFGAAAGALSLGGSAVVIEVDSDTTAGVETGAQINQAPGAAATQDLHITAFNDLKVDVVSGGIGVGLVGAGAGVGVVTLSNDTGAYLNGNARAADDVTLAALSSQKTDGVIFGGAGGAGALAVAVGVFDIGGDRSDTQFEYQDGDGNTVQGDALEAPAGENATATPIDPTKYSKEAIDVGLDSLLSAITPDMAASGSDEVDQLNSQTTAITTNARQIEEKPEFNLAEFDTSVGALSGTSAIVGDGTQLTAGGQIDVAARQDVHFKAVVGGAAVGGIAASGGVGVASLDNDVAARVGAGSYLSAGGSLSVNGQLLENAEFTGVAGAGAISAALSTAVVSLSDSSDVRAELGGTVASAETVSVVATSELGLYAETIQVSAAVFVAAGGAATLVSADGSSTAGILDGAVIGSAGNPAAVGGLQVEAADVLTIADVDTGSGDNNAMTTGGGAGIYAAAVGYARGEDHRDTLAYFGEDVVIATTAGVDLQANNSTELDVVTKGGSGGALAAGLMFAHAVVGSGADTAATRTEIRGGSSSRSRIDAGNVSISAQGDKLANAQTLAVAAGGFAIGGTNGTSEITAEVVTDLGSGLDVVAADHILVQAVSDIEGDALVHSVSGAVLSGGFTNGRVTVNPTTQTTVNDDARLMAGTGISVSARAGQAEQLGETIIAADYLQQTGDIRVHSRDANTGKLLGYQIDSGSGERLTDADGNFIVVYGTEDGDFQTAQGVAVDAAAVELRYVTLNLATGDVVQLHESGDGSGQYLDRDLSVIRVDDQTIALGETFNGANISGETDTIRFDTPHSLKDGDLVDISAPSPLEFGAEQIIFQNDTQDGALLPNGIYLPGHGLKLGDQVVYEAGDEVVPGLVDGQAYYVIVGQGENRDYLQLSLAEPARYPTFGSEEDKQQWQATIDASVIDLQRDTAAMGTQTLVPQLDDGLAGTYRVVVIDGYTVKLQQQGVTNSERLLATVSQIGETPSRENDIGKLYTDEFQHGDYISFYEFGYVDNVKAGEIDLVAVESDDGVTRYEFDQGANTLYLPGHDYQGGEVVYYYGGPDGTIANLYTEQPFGPPINSAIVKVIDENLIAFERDGSVVELDLPANLSRDSLGNVLDGEGNAAGYLDLGTLQLGEEKLYGLATANGYYVIDDDPNDGYIELSKTPGGEKLKFGLVDLDASGIAGIFVREGVDMQRGWGDVVLRHELPDLSASDIELRGVGGVALGEVLNAVGDSVSTVTIRNTSGGVANLGVSDGFLDMTVNTSVEVQGELHASGSIGISTDNKTVGTIDNQLVSVGALGAAKSTVSELNYTDTTAITISGDAVVDAGLNAVIQSESAPEMSALASARGGSALDGNSTAALTNVNVSNQLTVEDRANISAAGRGTTDSAGQPLPDLALRAITSGVASNNGWASSGGLVAGSAVNNGAGWRTSFTADTAVTVNGMAVVEANELVIEAINENIDLDSSAYLVLGGLFAGGGARAQITADLNADVSLLGSAQLRGAEGVQLNALNRNNTAHTDTEIWIIALGGGPAYARSNFTTASSVTTAAGTEIHAGADADNPVGLAIRAEDSDNTVGHHIDRHAIGPNHDNDTVDNQADVVLDGDVYISAVDSGYGLQVGSDGVVTQANGVTVDGGHGVGYRVGDSFTVDDIEGSSANLAQVDIRARTERGNKSSVQGDQSTFHYNTLDQELQISNDSDSEMIIGAIDTLGQASGAGIDPDVTLSAASNELSFTIDLEAIGSGVVIQGVGNIVTQGLIENRKGRTTISSAAGYIDNRAGRIHTQDLTLTAAQGNITADLVLFDDGENPVLEVATGGDLELTVETYVVDGDAVGSYQQQLGADFEIGGSAEFNLLGARAVTDVAVAVDAIRVLSTDHRDNPVPQKSGLYSGHFTTGKVADIATDGALAGGELTGVYQHTEAVLEVTADNLTFNGVAESGEAIAITATTDTRADGQINASTNGAVVIEESLGELRVGLIESTADNVTLKAQTGIVDADGAGDTAADRAQADVKGQVVSFEASEGAIGSAGDRLEIDSTVEVNALATGDIQFTEVAGDFVVGTGQLTYLNAVYTDVSGLYSLFGQVHVDTLDGSILSGSQSANSREVRISAQDISLNAIGGSIGDSDNALLVDDADRSATVQVSAAADEDITLAGGYTHLQLAEVEARGGSIEVTVPNTDQHLASLPTKLTVMEDGRVEAATSITLNLLHDFHARSGSSINAGTTLTINGDRPGVSPGRGSNMLFEGAIDTGSGAFIHGGEDEDFIHFKGATLGGEVTAYGHGNQDTLRVTELAPMVDPIESQVDGSITGRDVLNLVGGADIDDVDIYTHGSSDVRNNYVINVDGDSLDQTLHIWDAAHSDSIFLIRDTLGVASYPGDFNLVAVVNGTLDSATTSGGPVSVQRINVSTDTSAVWINGGRGDDYFAVDGFVGNSLVLEGGVGTADSFVLGQYFGSKRDAGAQVDALDKFATETLTGYDIELSATDNANNIAIFNAGGSYSLNYDVIVNAPQLNLDYPSEDTRTAYTQAVLMPGELNSLDIRPAQAGSTSLVVDEDVANAQVQANFEVTAGTLDVVDVVFSADQSGIVVDGLDDAAILAWQLEGDTLVGWLGGSDKGRLELQLSDVSISAGETGTVTVTASLVPERPGASRGLLHEDAPNLDQLQITGVAVDLVTELGWHDRAEVVAITVLDDKPTAEISGAGNYKLGERITGSWQYDAGADGLVFDSLQAVINGELYDLDQAVDVVHAGEVVGQVVVSRAGTWKLDLEPDANLEGNLQLTLGVELADRDGDAVTAEAAVLVEPTAPPLIKDLALTVADNRGEPWSDSDVIELEVQAGTYTVYGYEFDADLSGITVEGLDDGAELVWRLAGEGKTLIANDGTEDVLRLHLQTLGTIEPNTSGTLQVSARLTGALAHENAPNVDALVVTGINYKALSSGGTGVTSVGTATISLTVTDALPLITLEGEAPTLYPGDEFAGTWQAPFVSGHEHADGVSYRVTYDGVDYLLGSEITLSHNSQVLGTLVVNSDGTWKVTADSNSYDPVSGEEVTVQFDLSIEDGDGDIASATSAIDFDNSRASGPSVEAVSFELDENTLESKSQYIEISAGLHGVTDVAFDSDFSGVQVVGLDDAASLNWSINAAGEVVANDGVNDVLRLYVAPATLDAFETKQVAVVAVFQREFAHEDDINVDELEITGLKLVATDTSGAAASGDISIRVIDMLPQLQITGSNQVVAPGATITGGWSLVPIDGELRTDGVATYQVSVDGQTYALDQAIELMREGAVVGTLTVAADNSWQFTARAGLIAATDYVIDFTITATDGDGDSAHASAEFTVDIESAALPELAPIELTYVENMGDVTEEAVVNAGSNDIASIDWSSDFSDITVTGLDDAQSDIVWEVGSYGRLIGKVDGVVAIMLRLDGDATPFAPLSGAATSIDAGSSATISVNTLGTKSQLHEDSPNSDLLVIKGLKLTVTDSAGYSVDADVTFNVVDATVDIALTGSGQSVNLGDRVSGTYSFNDWGDAYSGGGQWALNTPGVTFLPSAGGGHVYVDGVHLGVLSTVDDNWHFDVSPDFVGVETSYDLDFTYTHYDRDGDSDSDVLQIQVQAQLRPSIGTQQITLQESDLGQSATVSGTLQAGSAAITGAEFGADLSGITVSGLSAATTLTWSLQGGALYGNDGTADVIKLELDADTPAAGLSGGYRVNAVQLAALDHTGSTVYVRNVPLVVTDAAGLQGTSVIRSITVVDDEPEVDIIHDGEIATPGATLVGSWQADEGADGRGDLVVVVDGQTYALDEAAEIHRDGSLLGSLIVKADGTWQLDMVAGLTGDLRYEVDLELRLTDGDGDTALASEQLAIQLPAETGSAGEDATLHVVDTSTLSQTSADLQYQAGSQAITSVAFGSELTAISIVGMDVFASLSWSLVDGVLVASDGTEPVLSLQLTGGSVPANSVGTVTLEATLSGALKHESVVNSDSLTISGITLVATDAAGNAISNSVEVVVADALPSVTIVGDGGTAFAGETLAGTWPADMGADGPGAYVVTVDGATYSLGEPVQIVRDGKQLGVFTVHADGTWAMVVAADLSSDGADQYYPVEFTIGLVDADKDSVEAQGALTVGARTYVPWQGEDATLTLDEARLTDPSSVALSYTAGSLALTSVGFSEDTDSIVVSGLDELASLSWSRVGTSLIGNNGSTDVISLDLMANPIAGGSSGQVTVTATLLAPLRHQDDTNVDSLSITGIELVATDAAGKQVSNSLAVTVIDDLPQASISGVDLSAQPGETLTGTWSAPLGADAGNLVWRLDGQVIAPDTPFTLTSDGRDVGTLQVNTDGSWTVQVDDGVVSTTGDVQVLNWSLELEARDSDGDVAGAALQFSAQLPAAAQAQLEAGTLVLDEAAMDEPQIIDLRLNAGSFDMVDVAFDVDTSGIQVQGLDGASALQWRLEDGALIADDGSNDVLKLTLASTPVLAGTEGVVSVTASLLAALAHEDDVNVDELLVEGITLVATDANGTELKQQIAVHVVDDGPSVTLEASAEVGKYRGGQVHSGTWSNDFGADGAGSVVVVINGEEYQVGETVEVRFGSDYAGDLTVAADGSWTFVGQKKTFDKSAKVKDIVFTVKAIDGDGDVASEDISFTLKRKWTSARSAAPVMSSSVAPVQPISVSSLDLQSMAPQTLITATAATATPVAQPLPSSSARTWLLTDSTGEWVEVADTRVPTALSQVAGAEISSRGDTWSVV